MKHAHKQPFTGGGMRKAHNVPGFVKGLGPGAENLQLLLDWEDYTAGTDLTNVYPDNSGIQSLTANNNPGVETASPIVGQQSGDYETDNNEYHSTQYVVPAQDVYIAVFANLESVSNFQPVVSNFNSGSGGVELQFTSTPEAGFATANSVTNFDLLKSGTLSTGTTYFIEGWYTQSNTTLHFRVDDGSELTRTGNFEKGSRNLAVGRRLTSNFYDGLIGMILLEVAPQGELFWPNHSTWLYNIGNGRSSDEILSYDP